MVSLLIIKARSSRSFLVTANVSLTWSTKRYFQDLVTVSLKPFSSRWSVTIIATLRRTLKVSKWSKSNRRHSRLTTKLTKLNCPHATQSSLVLPLTFQCSTTKWWRTTRLLVILLIKHSKMLSTKLTSLRRMISVMPRALLSCSKKTSVFGKTRRTRATRLMTFDSNDLRVK